MSRTLMSLLLIFSSLAAQDPAPVLSLPEMPEPVLGPDSMVKPDVPKGSLFPITWSESQVFPGTERQIIVYTPAHHDPAAEYAVMVFQDGHSYVNLKGDFRAPTVLDNLIHAKQIPPMVAIFIDPGHKGDSKPETPWRNNNRSFEYDTLSDDYARFLLDEILPMVSKTLRLKLTNDPEKRAICGSSSGAICAWTVAWQRPDAFRKVLASIGSFTNIRGGDVYPGLIRKTENKPIRAFFQEGINDLDNQAGSWPLANLQMQAALKFKHYDHKFVWGHGAHNGKHAGAIFPDALRWLWRE